MTNDLSHQRIRTDDPRTACRRWLAGARPGELLLVDFQFSCWWLGDQPGPQLTALYLLDGTGDLRCAVSDRPLPDAQGAAEEQFWQIVGRLELAVFTPGKLLSLAPCHIPKPWGQEIWYTGVEARGVCRFADEQGRTLPIPWLQAVMPADEAGAPGRPLVLLKILDPLPQEVTGDLYFELHQEKREVYVVTHVDREAWPGGVGGIRYGFDPEKLAEAGDEASFRQAYLEAVRHYEVVRREIDAIDGEVPAALITREVALREAMNAYTAIRPLRVGDVVVVPLLMPHSLQHGVRTIEFQTPVYERQILSFAQKVLTQDHWDTAEAVAQMRLAPPEEPPFQQLPAEVGVSVERIVDFPDFEVCRVHLSVGAAQGTGALDSYALAMVVEGELALDGMLFGAEQALFLPAGAGFELRSADPARPLVLLLARPRS